MLSKKGKTIMSAMKKEYGKLKGKGVFYASMNKGTIKGVEKRRKVADKVSKEMKSKKMNPIVAKSVVKMTKKKYI